ncbi:hypothetical protein [Corynebacterium phocae]|uniref:hypothetical protein n=1 Tax=Corynebacterium phocae TaxID=161895 RepID=UPI00123A21B1|nr:hypothetical protein [Corynebacterium phocae]KAA8723212.1 hypothetical protein F4V58_07820 [Corynebacterium phocae]
MKDPTGDQVEDTGQPAIYLGDMADNPDRALALIGPWVDDDDCSNPALRFMIVGRGAPGDQLGVMDDMARVMHVLWSNYPYLLTANREVAYCHRVANDPPVPDQNGRFRRVDTYETRMRVPKDFQPL